MKHQLDYLLNREETTQRQLSKELQIKMCACERGYPHTLTHVLTRCLLNFTSVCKTTTASVCTARPLCIPKMRHRPHAWLPGDRPPQPSLLAGGSDCCGCEGPSPDWEVFNKGRMTPARLSPWRVGVLSYLPLGDWRVRAAKERRWRGRKGSWGAQKEGIGENTTKPFSGDSRLPGPRPGGPRQGFGGSRPALRRAAAPCQCAQPCGAQRRPPGPGREREGGGRWYPCISISPVVRSPAFKEASQLPQSPLLWKANCARCCGKTQAPVYPGPAQSITILSERGLCLAQGHVAGHPAPPRFLSIFLSSQSFIS